MEKMHLIMDDFFNSNFPICNDIPECLLNIMLVDKNLFWKCHAMTKVTGDVKEKVKQF